MAGLSELKPDEPIIPEGSGDFLQSFMLGTVAAVATGARPY
jgi:hypothetical protein